MALKTGAGRSGSATINPLPLIDILLILVIFLLLMARQTVQTSAVEVQLPTTRNAQAHAPGLATVVTLEPDGRVRIDVHDLSVDELPAYLARATLRRVALRVDRRVMYDQVMQVLSTLRQNGISNVALLVTAQPEPSRSE